MSLSEEQLNKMHELAEHFEEFGDDKLNDWEKGFMFGNEQSKAQGFDGTMEKFHEVGAEMFMSGKQWAIVNKVYEKIFGN